MASMGQLQGQGVWGAIFLSQRLPGQPPLPTPPPHSLHPSSLHCWVPRDSTFQAGALRHHHCCLDSSWSLASSGTGRRVCKAAAVQSDLEAWRGTGALKPTHVLEAEGGTHPPNSTSQGSACSPPDGDPYSLEAARTASNWPPRFRLKGPRTCVIAQAPDLFSQLRPVLPASLQSHPPAPPSGTVSNRRKSTEELAESRDLGAWG